MASIQFLTAQIPALDFPPLDQPLLFNVKAASVIDSVGLSVRYKRDPLTYVIFETDIFTPRYAPVSTVQDLATTSVKFDIFEFGGKWRGDFLLLEAWGIEAAGARFVLPVYDFRAP